MAVVCTQAVGGTLAARWPVDPVVGTLSLQNPGHFAGTYLREAGLTESQRGDGEKRLTEDPVFNLGLPISAVSPFVCIDPIRGLFFFLSAVSVPSVVHLFSTAYADSA